MSNQHLAHEYLEWTKQKLDEIDATLLTLDQQLETMTAEARVPAERALAKIVAARDAFKAKVDAVLSDATAAKEATDGAYAALEAQWTEVELALQDFLAAVAGQAEVVKAVVTARADAQRKSLQSSFQAIRASASGAIDRARSEVDIVLQRLAAEHEKVEAKLGKVSAVGAESWNAVKGGLEETKSALERTWKTVSEAVSRIR